MDARLRTILKTVVLLGLALGAGAALFVGIKSGFSVWVGAGLAGANLYALAKLVGVLLPADETRKAAPGGTGAWLVVGLLKMALLFGGVWLLMSFRVVDPMPLFVGFACLPIGIAIGSIVSDRRAEKAA
jgi:uncharacterized membrane protein